MVCTVSCIFKNCHCVIFHLEIALQHGLDVRTDRNVWQWPNCGRVAEFSNAACNSARVLNFFHALGSFVSGKCRVSPLIQERRMGQILAHRTQFVAEDLGEQVNVFVVKGEGWHVEWLEPSKAVRRKRQEPPLCSRSRVSVGEVVG